MQTEKQRQEPSEAEKGFMHKREPYLDFNESMQPTSQEAQVPPAESAVESERADVQHEAEKVKAKPEDRQAELKSDDPKAEPKSDEPNVVQKPDEPELQQKLVKAEARAAEMQQAFLHAKADLENFRRRAQEDVARANKFAIEGFAESLMPVKDSLETALKIDSPSLDAIKEGVEMTLKQLNSAFEKNRLTEICPSPGDKLDPMKHQAISTVPVEQEQNPNTIINVLQKGYMIADRLLRPALVTVAQDKASKKEA